jgi:hypothetical protein
VLPSKAELACGELLASATDSGADVLPRDQKRSPLAIHSANEQVDVRMQRVVVVDCDPLEVPSEVPLNVIGELSGMSTQIELMASLRRHHHLPKPGIFLSLPAVQPLRYVDLVPLGIETESTLIVPLCTWAREVAPVRIPALAPTVPRVGDLRDAALEEARGKINT